MNTQRSKQKTTSLMLLGAVAVAVLAQAGAAVADDYKTFPGNMCQAPNQSDYVIYSDNGQFILNASGSQTWEVACPIVRDNTGNTNGLHDLDVWWTSLTPSDDFPCWAMSYSKTGTLLKTVEKRAVSGKIDGKINFGSLLNTSTDEGTFVVVCSLRAAGISHYRTREY